MKAVAVKHEHGWNATYNGSDQEWDVHCTEPVSQGMPCLADPTPEQYDEAIQCAVEARDNPYGGDGEDD